MRFFLIGVLFLFGTQISLAETSQEYVKRVSEHVNQVRFDLKLGQAAWRPDARPVKVFFRIGQDGAIKDVRILKSSVSPELSKIVARTFERLPPIPNVPKSMASKSFGVIVSIGGK